jgi:hypothetical protein
MTKNLSLEQCRLSEALEQNAKLRLAAETGSLEGGPRLIELTKGMATLVDADDYERLSKRNWCASWTGKSYIAKCGFSIDTVQYRVFMHRFIMACPEGLFVDHINHNPLDNRKRNLRICTHAENNTNKRKQRITSSRFKGVTKHGNGWIAQLKTEKGQYLGFFKNEEDAFEEYKRSAIKIYGEFACFENIT